MSDSRQEEHRQANLVLLADDQAKVRSALRLWLSRQAGIQILGEAVDATGVIDWIKAACPDVILLDWELPGRKARELIAALRRIYWRRCNAWAAGTWARIQRDHQWLTMLEAEGIMAAA
jgi:DNA-binding NarL/FixJ family response regulator